MKILHLICSASFVIANSMPAMAADDNGKALKTEEQVTPTNQAPQMSEIPTMKAQGKRMAELMQKIQDVKDPAERKRMLAEAMCPQ